MSAPIESDCILRAITDGVVVCDKEGRLLLFNPAFPKILGHKAEGIKDKSISTDVLERHLEWKALVSLLEQGSPVDDYEARFVRADGSIGTASISASLMRDQSGAIAGIAMVFRDISTRKEMERELRDKAFRVDVINKIAKAASAEVKVRRRALSSISSELRKLVNFDLLTVGITEENGRHVDVLIPEPDVPSAKRSLGLVPLEGSIVEKLKLSRTPLIVQRDADRKEYTEFAVLDISKIASMVCVPLVSRGRVIGSVNVFSSRPGEYNVDTADVLQLVADQVAGLIDNMVLFSYLEKKVKLNELLIKTGVEVQKEISTAGIYKSIATNLGEIVPYADLSVYVVDWQRKAIIPAYVAGSYVDEVMASWGTLDEGIVGWVVKAGKPEIVDDVDADPRAVEIPGVPPEHQALLAIPLSDQDGVIGVLEIYRPTGQLFTNSDLEAAKLFAQQASVALSNANLVTKLQDIKHEIELLNDLMFHDINNYNFAVMNYIQMIAKSKALPDEDKVHLEKSLHLIRQTADLIEKVKKLAKIGVLSPKEFVQVDLAEILQKTVSGLENSFPGRSVSVNLKTPEKAPVVANKLIEELFANLLSNSVKYDPHDEVEIDVECVKVIEDGKSFWKTCISDHGHGIPDTKKPLLFQKYVRLKPDPDIPGTGLGLSISRALADKFGGRIWVEDRVAGNHELGARFCVLLPAAK